MPEDLLPPDHEEELQIIQIKAISGLLSIPVLALTQEEEVEFNTRQMATFILGPAAGAVLVCPGNQENTPEDDRCPYYAKCYLRSISKAPAGKLCPVECRLTEGRFSAWCKELGKDPEDLSESERSVVSELTWIDLKIERINNMLASGSNAQLTQRNINDAILVDEDKAPIIVSSEKVSNVLNEELAKLSNQRLNLLKSWMLTPEQKFKIEKAKKKGPEGYNPLDAGNYLSTMADKARDIK
jgi:hypothetical protein